jgi:SAM-dependent methyltransferase
VISKLRAFATRLIPFLRRGPRHVAARLYYVLLAPKARHYPLIAKNLKGRGLEIGGPSAIFGRRGLLPVYPHISELDNCNFGSETVWEGRLTEGRNFRFGERTGFQFVSEAWAIKVPDASYDFVMSSHMLEHSANPIRVLAEWRRLLKPGGYLLLVLPEGRSTYDRRRPVTTLEHLVDDFNRSTPESDPTHFDEIAALHTEHPDREGLRKSLEGNEVHRMAHHHVFDQALSLKLVHHAGFEVLAHELEYPCHIIVFARKTAGDTMALDR